MGHFARLCEFWRRVNATGKRSFKRHGRIRGNAFTGITAALGLRFVQKQAIRCAFLNVIRQDSRYQRTGKRGRGMTCPRCGSTRVFRSGSHDKALRTPVPRIIQLPVSDAAQKVPSKAPGAVPFLPSACAVRAVTHNVVGINSPILRYA
jgi:hypothetical protein